MGRPRTDFSGAIHHVYARGNNKRDIFLNDSDRLFFLDRLEELKAEAGFKLYALCLMTNHFHLLIESGREALSTIMQRLLTAHSMRFNKKYGTVGHLFQNRFGSRLCSRDAYFLRLVRYIHRNPVAAGLVASPGAWRWSGHGDLLKGESGLLDCAFPLSFFGEGHGARAAYAAFLGDAGDDQWTPPHLDESITDEREPLWPLLGEVAAEFRLEALDLASGRRLRSLMAAKREFVRRGLDAGYSQAELARSLRCTDAAVAYLRSDNN
jgi:REP element-mobilizing transposase RayT